MNALVSVIIPTHNRVGLLPRAIDSVLNQSYQELECIVVDDASTDDSEIVIAQFDDDRLVYLQHENSRGASAARNTGIAHAQGELIAFLDDDDEWLPDKLEKQVSLLEAAPTQVGMVYCWFDYYDGEDVVESRHPQLRGDIFERTLSSQPIGNASTLLVRRSVIDHVGNFDEALPRGNDGDFIRRVVREYWVDYVPEVLVRVYIRHGHRRISQDDERGIRERIIAKNARFERYRTEYEHHPAQYAQALSELALCHSLLGEHCQAIRLFRKAFLTFPFSSIVLRNIAKSIIQGLDFRRKLCS